MRNALGRTGKQWFVEHADEVFNAAKGENAAKQACEFVKQNAVVDKDGQWTVEWEGRRVLFCSKQELQEVLAANVTGSKSICGRRKCTRD